MAYKESGRKHLSADILRRIDTPTLPYHEMLPGQPLLIHAQDAITRDQSSFTVRVVSVRDVNPRRSMKAATLEYQEGDFNFYDGSNPDQSVQLVPGTLMENGISGKLVPQADYRLAYFGGIGLGRDHSFEFIGGEDRSVVVQRLTEIEVGAAPEGYQTPDITQHLQRAEQAKMRQMEDDARRVEEVNRIVMADLEEWFSEHPAYQDMRDLIAGYSANGKLFMSSYLIYGQEDGVIDKAWEALKKADHDHFSYEHPAIRGELQLKASSRNVFVNMLREAGIQWPRPEPTQES